MKRRRKSIGARIGRLSIDDLQRRKVEAIEADSTNNLVLYIIIPTYEDVIALFLCWVIVMFKTGTLSLSTST